jgi:hypothetical protein
MSKLLMSLMLVVFAVFGSGCSVSTWHYKHGEVPSHIVNAREIPVYVDSKFTNVEIVQLNAALQEWNGVFNGQIVLRLVRKFNDGRDAMMLAREVSNTHNGWMIAKLDSDDERLEEIVSPGMLAFVPQLGGQLMVVLGDRVSTHNLKTIAMHEMGHMLGAEHVFGRNLMHPAYGPLQTDCIDKVTVNQVAFFNDLEVSSLNYCVTPDYK